jgi:hypothetical protein
MFIPYSLGTGEIGHMFHEPPENIHDREGRGGGRKTEVGFKGFMMDKIAGMSAGIGSNKKKTKSKSTTSSSTTRSVKDTTTSSSTGNSITKIEKVVKQTSQSSSSGKAETSGKELSAAERLEERKKARLLRKQQKQKV